MRYCMGVNFTSMPLEDFSNLLLTVQVENLGDTDLALLVDALDVSISETSQIASISSTISSPDNSSASPLFSCSEFFTIRDDNDPALLRRQDRVPFVLEGHERQFFVYSIAPLLQQLPPTTSLSLQEARYLPLDVRLRWKPVGWSRPGEIVSSYHPRVDLNDFLEHLKRPIRALFDRWCGFRLCFSSLMAPL